MSVCGEKGEDDGDKRGRERTVDWAQWWRRICDLSVCEIDVCEWKDERKERKEREERRWNLEKTLRLQ